MLEELKRYKYIKKSKSELEMDRLVNNINYKLWTDNGYDIIYYLGIIDQLKVIAESMGDHNSLKREDILKLISSFKTIDSTPDEIKNLVDMVLDEFDYKEDTK